MSTDDAAPVRAAVDFSRPVALALSGGGYRAAAFHLGMLDYLEQVGLEPRVEMISTVSGGTFTGARYAVSLVEEESFQQFFEQFYRFLRDTDLVELGLRRLGRPGTEVPSGRSNLIVSVAQVYAETFLQDGAGQPYRLGQILDADIRLRDAVFNAADFRNGLAFRFQRSANARARIGNHELSIPIPERAPRRCAWPTSSPPLPAFPAGSSRWPFPTTSPGPAGRCPRS